MGIETERAKERERGRERGEGERERDVPKTLHENKITIVLTN